MRKKIENLVQEPGLIFLPGKNYKYKMAWVILYLLFYPGKKLTWVPVRHY